jgi:hypothetical protein
MICSFHVELYTLQLCKKQISVADFAGKSCANFSKLLPELDPKGSGLQAPHENCKQQHITILNETMEFQIIRYQCFTCVLGNHRFHSFLILFTTLILCCDHDNLQSFLINLIFTLCYLLDDLLLIILIYS